MTKEAKMTAETDVYRNLQKHLDKMPVGFPATKSGVELDVLRGIFTPEQAKIATHLDYKHKSVDQIFETAEADVSSKTELKRILDEAVSNGGIFRRKRDGEAQYALLPFILWGMFEHQLKRLDEAFLNDAGQYLMGEFGLELATSRLPKMRVIPVEESVSAEHHITTYDELRHLIEQAGEHIAVQECFCRKTSDMQGNACQATDRREICMSLGDLSDLYVDEGWGRRIDQEEALEIARRNEEDALVLMPGNEQEPNFMCACCSDCCGMLSMIKNFPKPADMVASNYYAQVDTALCAGCGTCVDRCPLEAVEKQDGHSTVDLKRCIGCGLCVPTCPDNAMRLIRKDKEVVPPRTEEDHFDTILAQKSTLAGRMRDYSLKTFLRVVSSLSR
jgi:formate hydrogenlyase subunit 6/NADH:ubiquinone oxidoreductase subunit I